MSKFVKIVKKCPLVYLTPPLTHNPTVIMMLRVLGLGSKGKVLSIEWAHLGPLVYLTAPLTPNPTVIMMVRVLGLGSKGKVLSIEY